MNIRTRSLIAFACALVALTVTTATASAAPPANDALANATPLTIGQTENGTTTDAVDEGETVSGLGWALNNSVWYTYTPSNSGLFYLSVCADFGVNVVVMTGSSSPYNWASYNPNSFVQQYGTQSDCSDGPGTKYKATVGPFPASAGVQLKVQISSSFGGPSNTGPFSLTPSFTAVPANDNFAGAQVLSDDTLTNGSNVASTTEIGETFTGLSWGYYNSVWYRYTAPSDGTLVVGLCSEFGHNLIPAFGSLGSLAIGDGYPTPARQSYTDPQNCGNGTYASSLTVPVTSGQVVSIHVGSAYAGIANQGSFSIRASLIGTPANDLFANATDLGSSPSVDATGFNNATELYGSGEPAIAGSNRPNMVWYRWTAPSSGAASLDTCDTLGNLTVGVFSSNLENPALADLQPVAGETEGCSAGHGARTGIATEAGRNYWIAVASDTQYSYGEARFKLKILLKPVNDNWSDAIDLGSATTVNLATSNVNATPDFNPDTFEQLGPTIGAQPLRSSTVWFKWTAPRNDSFRFDACAGAPNGYDGYMAVFSRNSESDPVPPYYNLLDRATSDDDCGSLGDWPRMPASTVSVIQGKVYWIGFGAATINADSGTNFTLRISSRPVNTELPTLSSDDEFTGTQLTSDVGEWDGTPTIDYAYRWDRCDAAGDNCEQIDGATGQNYTPDASSIGKRIKLRVTASNFVGNDSAYSALTGVIDADTDEDGVGDADDNCDFAQPGGYVKSNGCAPEGIEITTNPSIVGDRAVGSEDGLTVDPGAAANDPGEDDSIDAPEVSHVDWFRCSEPDGGTCDTVTADGPGGAYVADEDDLGKYIRARVTWANDDTSYAEWADGVPIYKISIGPRPSLSGAAQVGQTMTGNAGGAVNQPETELGDAAPSVLSSFWYFCDSPTDGDSCVMGPAGDTLVVPASAQGKYLRFGVVWTNGITSRSESSDASGQVAAAPVTPPATPDPLNLGSLKLPKKASAKGVVKSKGKFTIKSIQIPCPAGGADCKISLTYTAKVKKKTKKLGSGTLTIPAGQTKPLAGKFSSAGVKLIKASKKLEVTIAMKGSGGGTGKATFKEFTVTK